MITLFVQKYYAFLAEVPSFMVTVKDARNETLFSDEVKSTQAINEIADQFRTEDIVWSK